MSKSNDKYLTESISLLDREFGQPLPTLQSVMEKHQENQASDWKGNDNISEGREEKAKAKKQLQMFIKEEGVLRKRLIKLEKVFKEDSENKDLAKQINKAYKDNVTKFMREAVGLVNRMK